MQLSKRKGVNGFLFLNLYVELPLTKIYMVLWPIYIWWMIRTCLYPF